MFLVKGASDQKPPVGPVNLSELKKLYENGHLSAHALVSENGGDAWIPLHQGLSSSGFSSFATVEDVEEYDEGSPIYGGSSKSRRPTSMKSTLKNIQSSMIGKEIVRGLAGLRRVSLTGTELDAIPPTPLTNVGGTAAPTSLPPNSFSIGPPASTATTAASLAPPALWRSSSTPTGGGAKRALKALAGMNVSSNFSGIPPGSPRGHSHGSELTDDEDVGDVLSTVRTLALALNQAIDQVDHIESSLKKSSPHKGSGPSTRELELEIENNQLKERLQNISSLIAERAPNLVAEVDAIAGVSAATASSVVEPPSSQIRPIPLEADSPMLRDRMSKSEISLDELRQSLKLCVKSGQAYIANSSQPIEAGRRSFAVDLAKSGNYLLEMVGQVLLSLREGRERLMSHIETDFVLPLASFANQDLKKANHASAELERRREVGLFLLSSPFSHCYWQSGFFRFVVSSRIQSRSTYIEKKGGGVNLHRINL